MSLLHRFLVLVLSLALMGVPGWASAHLEVGSSSSVKVSQLTAAASHCADHAPAKLSAHTATHTAACGLYCALLAGAPLSAAAIPLEHAGREVQVPFAPQLMPEDIAYSIFKPPKTIS